MKLLPIFLLTLICCKSKLDKTSSDRTDQLSNWLLANEKQMFRELKAIVDTAHLCSTCDTNFTSRTFMVDDSTTIYGTFQAKLKQILPGLEVQYHYEKSDTDKLGIRLVHRDKRSISNVLDTILILPVYKQFYIVKYEPPVGENTLYQLEYALIDVRRMGFRVVPKETRYDVTIYVQDTSKQLRLQELQELELGRQVFGEEALVRKINKIGYEIVGHLPDTLIRFRDAKILIRE